MLYRDPDGLKVRICDTAGNCTDSNTDISDDDFDQWFRRTSGIKAKDGKIYQNGELIGTFQRISCDSCMYDIYDLGRRVVEADSPRKAVMLYGRAAVATLQGASGIAQFGVEVLVAVVEVRSDPEDQSVSAAASIKADRQAAVRDAWRQEAERARTGQPTRTPFTADELRELRDTGKVSGYEGHHTESVNGNPQSARDANKIKFVKGRAAHLREHGGNWRNRTPRGRR